MRAAIALMMLLASVSLARANEDPDTEVARKHFNAGRSSYDAGQYVDALSEFEAARRVRPHPALDYNIARCNDRLERYQAAIDAYERYIASNPPDVADMRTRVEQLKVRLASLPPPSPQPQTRIEHETVLVPIEVAGPPPKSNRRTIGIVLGVLGGAVLIGGGIAIGLLVKPTTQAPTPDSTGGPHRATP